MPDNRPVARSVQARRSVRAFNDQPVTREALLSLLQIAGHAPSNGNTQPWRVHALTGEAKAQLSRAVMAQAAITPAGDAPDYPIYPGGLADPWRERRYDCGERLYGALGIGRDDRQARMAQGARNLTFFDAPVGLILTLDRSLGPLQILDCGIFVQTFMLLAEEAGLATCPQAVWSMWAGTIRRVLDLPEAETVLMGIALGYADHTEIAANIAMPRAPAEQFATLRGFD